MKKILVMFMLIIFAVSVSAIATNITVVSDDVYTGAILKLRSLESGELGDPYYPFFVGENIGIIKFEVETSLSEVNLSLRFTNNGKVSLQTEEGPLAINGSDIIVDLGVIEEVVPLVNEAVENVSVEVDLEDSEKKQTLLTGYAVKDYSVGVNANYLFLGLGVFFAGIFMFFIVKRAYKKGAEGELKLLGKMEIDRKIDALDDK